MHFILNKAKTIFVTVMKHLKNSFIDFITDWMSFAVVASIFAQSIIFLILIQNNSAASLKYKTGMISHNDYVYSLLLAMIIVSFAFLFNRRKKVIFLIVINMLFSILIIADLWYYRAFQDFLSINNLGESQNMNNMLSDVLSLGRPVDLIIIVIDIIIISLAIFSLKRYRNFERRFVTFAVVLVLPIVILFSKNIYLAQEYVPLQTMKDYTPLGYHLYDIKLYAEEIKLHQLSEEDKVKIDNWISYKNENLPDNSYAGKFKGKNLICIQVESLENFVINSKVEGQEVTPVLNKLLGNSFYFSNLYAQINNGNSGDADLMVNTSVLPIRRGSTFFRYPNNKYNTLGNLLKDENYSTQSMHASSGVIWNVANALKNFSFDHSYDLGDFEDGDIWAMGLTDKYYWGTVEKELQKQSNPFYYYTVTVSSHMAFEPREDMKGLKLDKELDNSIMGKYLQVINYADAQIGAFLEDLDRKGILDNTVVVIYGDHEGVHKYYNDQLSSSSYHEAWWDNNGKLPLIIYDKSLKGKVVQTIGGEVDIMPTLAYILGVDKSKYENTTMGRNLLNTNKSYAITNNGIISSGNFTAEDEAHLKESFSIADLIIQTDYFNK